jgi:hypothetical protein
MQRKSATYTYLNVTGGSTQYGKVEIESNFSASESGVTDACEWKTFKEAYPAFIELGILKIWKQSAIQAAEVILETYMLPNPVEITIKDITGIYVDTMPSHIGAAMAIGIFDLCNSPLDITDLAILEDFISQNNAADIIPDYSTMILTKPKKV